MLIVTTKALEGRYMAVVDIPGEYLSADMDDEAKVVFIGTLSELMVASNTELYRQFV